MKRSKDKAENYFGSLPKISIDAKLINGKLIDLNTNQELSLKENSICQIVTLQANLGDDVYEKYTQRTVNTVLSKHTKLHIKMPTDNNEMYTLHIVLLDDLKMEKRGVKPSRILESKCDVVGCEFFGKLNPPVKFKSFESASLNQAFVRTSVLLRPESKSHVTNIYKSCFLEDGRCLEDLRF